MQVVLKFIARVIPDSCTFRFTDLPLYFNDFDGPSTLPRREWNYMMQGFLTTCSRWYMVYHCVTVIKDVLKEEAIRRDQDISDLNSKISKYTIEASLA